MASTIQVIIPEEGELFIKTRGFAGSSCRKATEGLEKALGRKTSDVATAEALQQPQQRTAQAGH